MNLPVFNYSLMDILCKELQNRILYFKVIGCFSSDPKSFFLILQGPKNQETLFFCFTPPLLRFHLIHSSMVIPSLSHNPLHSLLQNTVINHISLLQKDRILQLTFSTTTGDLHLVAEFFSKHPNYYLLQSNKFILFALHHYSQKYYQLPALSLSFTSEIPHWHSHREVEQAYIEIEEAWKFNKEKRNLQILINKSIAKKEKKEKLLLENVKQCLQWSTIQHEGDLIKFHFASIKKGLSPVYVHDWLTNQPHYLELSPTKTLQEEMAARYKRAKKLKAGQRHLIQHLEQTQKELHFLKQEQHTLSLINTIEELINFKSSLSFSFQQTNRVVKPPSLIYREYESANGTKIWVGKNDKANDRLTFQLARGYDWWLHIRGHPGSHVIIRLEKNLELNSETLKDALQLALYYSKARSQGEGEIWFTQRKYVSRLKKAKPGLVQISKHQTAWVQLDSVRLQVLKERISNRSF